MVLTEPASCPPLAADELGAGVTVAGICRASDAMDGDVDDIAAVLAESFGALPDRAGELAADLHRTLGDPRIALALIRVDGVAAAVAKATSFDGFTYLSSIGTRARFRGRGLAGLATRHAVAIAGGTAAHVVVPRRVQRQRPRPPAVPPARVRLRGRVARPPARVRMWARLTWQADDPERLAADLARRLGAETSRHDWQDQAFAIRLRNATLEVVPWRRESPSDDPLPGGRLVFEGVPGGLAKPSAGRAAAVRPRRGSGGRRSSSTGPRPSSRNGWPARRGTRTRTSPTRSSAPAPGSGSQTGCPASEIVLLEPTTEGRLAGSLVRDGEGPCALYIHPAGGLEPGWCARVSGASGRAASRRVRSADRSSSPAAPLPGRTCWSSTPADRGSHPAGTIRA